MNKFKLIIILFILSIALPQFSYSRIKVDVKTKLLEKADMTGIKNGLIAYLENSSDFKVVEWREDYELWLENFNYKKRGDKVTITFNIQIKGNGINKKSKRLSFKYSDSDLSLTIDKILKKRKYSQISSNSVLETLRTGKDGDERYIQALLGGKLAYDAFKKMMR